MKFLCLSFGLLCSNDPSIIYGPDGCPTISSLYVARNSHGLYVGLWECSKHGVDCKPLTAKKATP